MGFGLTTLESHSINATESFATGSRLRISVSLIGAEVLMLLGMILLKDRRPGGSLGGRSIL